MHTDLPDMEAVNDVVRIARPLGPQHGVDLFSFERLTLDPHLLHALPGGVADGEFHE
jgi:hypothetical protein